MAGKNEKQLEDRNALGAVEEKELDGDINEVFASPQLKVCSQQCSLGGYFHKTLPLQSSLCVRESVY